MVDGRLRQAGIVLGVMLLQAVFVVVTIWAFYGFRYSAFHEPVAGNEQLFFQGGTMVLATAARAASLSSSPGTTTSCRRPTSMATACA